MLNKKIDPSQALNNFFIGNRDPHPLLYLKLLLYIFFLLFSASSILVKKKARGSHCPLLPPSVVSEKFVSEMVLIAAACPVSTKETCVELRRAELCKQRLFQSFGGGLLVCVLWQDSAICPALTNSYSMVHGFTRSVLIYLLVCFRAQVDLCENLLLFRVSQHTSHVSLLYFHVPCMCTVIIRHQNLDIRIYFIYTVIWGIQNRSQCQRACLMGTRPWFDIQY